MKRFLALLLFLSSIVAHATGITFVQSAAALPTGTSGTLAYSSNVASGNYLVIYYQTCCVAPSVVAPTDTLTTTYILLDAWPGLGNGYAIYMWIGVAPSSAADTVSFGGVIANQSQVVIEEWNGGIAGVSHGAPATFLLTTNLSVGATGGGTGTPLTALSAVVLTTAANCDGGTANNVPMSSTNVTIRYQQVDPAAKCNFAVGDYVIAANTSLSSGNAANWTTTVNATGGSNTIILEYPPSPTIIPMNTGIAY